jgi:signal peptidase I
LTPRRRAWIELALLLGALAFAVFMRSEVVAIYQIPSDSMLPRVFTGDALLAAKWRFAFRHELPERGDIVIFHVPSAKRDYVKRVIGLPGDRVALRNGIVFLNGNALPREPMADWVMPIAPNSPCHEMPNAAIHAVRRPDGSMVCVYARYRESLPDGRRYELLDLGGTPLDDYGPVTVPGNQLFVLGDNRDLSADSRVLPRDGGVGLVPVDRVVGRAASILFSVDGSATWDAPESWVKAVRWKRIGVHF